MFLGAVQFFINQVMSWIHNLCSPPQWNSFVTNSTGSHWIPTWLSFIVPQGRRYLYVYKYISIKATRGWKTMWQGAFQQKRRVVLQNAYLQMYPEFCSMGFSGYFWHRPLPMAEKKHDQLWDALDCQILSSEGRKRPSSVGIDSPILTQLVSSWSDLQLSCL